MSGSRVALHPCKCFLNFREHMNLIIESEINSELIMELIPELILNLIKVRDIHQVQSSIIIPPCKFFRLNIYCKKYKCP